MENNNSGTRFEGIEWRLITNYISGEITPSEKILVEEWIGQNPDRKIQIEKLEKIWNSGIEQEDLETAEAAWTDLEKRLISDSEKRSSSILALLTKSYPVKVAVAVLILIAGYFLLSQLNLFNNNSGSEITWNEKKTEPGQKSILTLFDGSRITLNAGSKLKYPKQFGTDVREVFLEGEAYFEVKRNESRPFIVRSGNISTTVLGTEFNVKAFPEESRIAVSLVDGKVSVHKSNDPGQFMLNPSQQFIYEKTSGREVISTFDLSQAVGWKNDLFKFENERLENVIAVLERAYGVEIEIKDKSLLNKRITTQFNQDSFWTMIKVLREVTGLNFRTVHKDNEVQKVIFY